MSINQFPTLTYYRSDVNNQNVPRSFQTLSTTIQKTALLESDFVQKMSALRLKTNVQEPYAALNILWRPVKKPVLLRERVYLNGRLSDRGLPTCKLAKDFTICPVCVGFPMSFGHVATC